MIADSALVASNTIHSNFGPGIAVSSDSGNTIQMNVIHSNDGLGIDLIGDGVTPNDLGDADSGPNELQNFPVLTLASNVGGSTAIEGTLNSTANTDSRVEFFQNTECDPSGHGEGEMYVGSSSITTDASGDVSFAVTLGAAVPVGSFITATATDPSGNTSEFSACLAVAGPTNRPPEASAGLDQRLECAGSLCPITLDGSGSSDPDSSAGTNDDIAGSSWYLNYGMPDEQLLASGEVVPVFFALGTHVVTLEVVDQLGATDTDTVEITIDPARLSLVDLEKVDIKWPENAGEVAELKVHGNLGLPVGLLPSEVSPVGTFGLDVAGQLGVVSQAVTFELKGSYGEKWQFRGDESNLGLDHFDIHFDGAKFKFSDTVELQTDFIGVIETALALDRRGTDLPVSLSVSGGGVATVTASIDELGVVESSVPVESDEDGEVTFTLPFELTPEMEIELTVGGQSSQILLVGDYYTASNGRFQVKGSFDPGTLNGASRPAEVEVDFALGTEGFPGSAVVFEQEWKKLSEREWKAKLKE